tara:strand:- start:201 stop:851 length:651 start_codon:yes stop_codon:yes gene_type:complete
VLNTHLEYSWIYLANTSTKTGSLWNINIAASSTHFLILEMIQAQMMVSEEFVLNLIDCQAKLYSYVLSLTGNKNDAHDILQETNKSVLEKAADFTPGTSFSAWASKIAYYKVLSYHRDAQRDTLLFNAELLKEISEKSISKNQQYDRRLGSLFHCLEQLPDDHQRLLKQRYQEEKTLEEIAGIWGRTYNGITSLLYRLRLALIDCVDKSLQLEDGL